MQSDSAAHQPAVAQKATDQALDKASIPLCDWDLLSPHLKLGSWSKSAQRWALRKHQFQRNSLSAACVHQPADNLSPASWAYDAGTPHRENGLADCCSVCSSGDLSVVQCWLWPFIMRRILLSATSASMRAWRIGPQMKRFLRGHPIWTSSSRTSPSR